VLLDLHQANKAFLSLRAEERTGEGVTCRTKWLASRTLSKHTAAVRTTFLTTGFFCAEAAQGEPPPACAAARPLRTEAGCQLESQPTGRADKLATRWLGRWLGFDCLDRAGRTQGSEASSHPADTERSPRSKPGKCTVAQESWGQASKQP